jgi:RimJ/RimL family protein N-acetyltransferase
MLFPDLFRDDVFHLETAGLWLRWPRAADAVHLKRFAGLAAVAEMTATWPHPLPDGEADRRILRARQANADGIAIVLTIARKREPRQMIGMVSLHVERHGENDAGHRLGLGYMLDPVFHARGLMTEAVRALVGAGFRFTLARSVAASCLPVNPASRRVLEKSGFVHLGDSTHSAPARGAPQVCHDFEFTRGRWMLTDFSGNPIGRSSFSDEGAAA